MLRALNQCECGCTREDHAFTSALPPSIADCTALTSLNLGKCEQLKSLPEDLFNLPLKSLEIDYCKKLPFDIIDTICQKMPQLESLNLGGLKMAGYPIVIALMKANGLNVKAHGCPLAQLTGDISAVKDATNLDFSGLPITSIPDEISKLQNLQTLSLRSTKIKSE